MNEHQPSKLRVAGSSPAAPTSFTFPSPSSRRLDREIRLANRRTSPALNGVTAALVDLSETLMVAMKNAIDSVQDARERGVPETVIVAWVENLHKRINEARFEPECVHGGAA